MSEFSIAVEIRVERGKGPARRMRAHGRVPAIVYGRGKQSVSVSFEPKSLEQQIHASSAGLNTLFALDGADAVAGRTVMVKELQREPVKGTIVHVDLLEIDRTERIHVSVPVRLHGEALGVTMGGVLEHTLREVELSCLPGAIPDELVVDVSEVELGQSVHVGQVRLPANVELASDAELTVLSVAVPRGMAEEEAEAAEAAEGEGEGEQPGEAAEGESSAADEGGES